MHSDEENGVVSATAEPLQNALMIFSFSRRILQVPLGSGSRMSSFPLYLYPAAVEPAETPSAVHPDWSSRKLTSPAPGCSVSNTRSCAPLSVGSSADPAAGSGNGLPGALFERNLASFAGFTSEILPGMVTSAPWAAADNASTAPAMTIQPVLRAMASPPSREPRT